MGGEWGVWVWWVGAWVVVVGCVAGGEGWVEGTHAQGQSVESQIKDSHNSTTMTKRHNHAHAGRAPTPARPPTITTTYMLQNTRMPKHVGATHALDFVTTY